MIIRGTIRAGCRRPAGGVMEDPTGESPAGADGLRQPSDPGSAGSVVWLLLMSLTLNVFLLPFSSYIAALSYIQEEWGLSNSEAGAAFSFYLLGYAVSALVVMPLTDRVGAKRVFMAAAAVSTVSHCLFPLLAYDMVSAAALRAAAGVGLVGLYMPGLRIIGERFESGRRGAAMGVYVTAFYLAVSLSLSATGALMTWLEWREAYLAVSLAAFAGVPAAYLLLRGTAQPTATGSSGVLDLRVLRNRAARYLIMGYSLHAFELYSVRIWLPAFLTAVLVARGVEVERAVVAAATFGGLALALGSVGPALGGIASDRWGRASSAAGIFAVSGLCSLAVGWTGGLGVPWTAIIALVMVYGLAVAADSAIYTTAIVERAEPERLGRRWRCSPSWGSRAASPGPSLSGESWTPRRSPWSGASPSRSWAWWLPSPWRGWRGCMFCPGRSGRMARRDGSGRGGYRFQNWARQGRVTARAGDSASAGRRRRSC